MTSHPTRRRATAIIELPQGILLTSHRPGLYLLPGGAVDPGERSIQAVIREVIEETGLVAHTVVRLFEHTSASNRHVVFLVQAKGKPAPRHEIKELAYYTPSVTLPMSAATEQIIGHYLALKEQHADTFRALDAVGGIGLS
ncbi:MAG: NUDIX domain-containing protein [Oscillochloris sp.]|nr:NUDIX domain-containing protein [Oscillochloris sp.]